MPVRSSFFLQTSYDGVAVRVNFLKEKSSIIPPRFAQRSSIPPSPGVTSTLRSALRALTSILPSLSLTLHSPDPGWHLVCQLQFLQTLA